MGLYENSTYLADLDVATAAVCSLETLCGKTVLITGASGLIGSTVADILLRANETRGLGVTVVVTGRDRGRLRQRFTGVSFAPVVEELDVCRPIGLDRRVDVILHAASNADPASITSDPVGTIEANVGGTGRLLMWGWEHGCSRLLYVSSGEVYGQMQADAPVFSEEMQGYVDPLRLRSCYPLAKRMAENLCISFSKQFGMESVSARLCHTFGVCASARDSRAHEQFLRAAIAGEDVVLRSRGEQVRSYLYAMDAASAILTILTKGESGRAYNVASDEAVSVASLARCIAGIAGTGVVFDIPAARRADDTPITRQVLDASALRGLGWSSSFLLEEGVSHTLAVRRALASERNDKNA